MKSLHVFLVTGFLLPTGLLAQSGKLARELNDAFADVYERVAPAVVVIEVRAPRDASPVRLPGGSLPQGLDFFFRNPNGGNLPPRTDQGSGFLISKDGLIVTNNHVVEGGENGKITVQLRDGRKFDARLLGRDARSDLAVLKIDGADLPTVELADSDSIRVGQFAFAIGAPFDLPYTFTVGVVSATGRVNLTGSPNYEEFIQTDASINPGNSGGPLCDIDGRVIGVNTLISGINRGLGFAVPINIAKDVSAQIIERGRVSRPWLGIGIIGLEEDEERAALFPGVQSGVLVESIQPGTPAHRSELLPGDVILKVDGREVSLAGDLQKEILGKQVGQVLQLEVWRRGRVTKVSVRTGEQPDDLIRASFNVQPVPVPPQIFPIPSPDAVQPPADKAPAPQTGPAPRFGLVLENVGKRQGVRVVEVVEGSPAEAAGFEVGDVITEMAGRPVAGMGDFDALAGGADLGRGVMILLHRNGERTFAILKQ